MKSKIFYQLLNVSLIMLALCGSVVYVANTFFPELSFMKVAILIAIIVVCTCIGASWAITRKTMEAINQIDVKNPIDNPVFEEITPLLLKIDKQNHKIEEHLRDISKKKHELADIMGNIHESIVVISKEGTVLSLNDAALKMFAKQKDECIGKYLLNVNRDAVFLDIIEKIKTTPQFQVDFSTNGKIYRVAVSNSSINGSILIFLDVTERRAAQKMRVEFSSNVSHELKTPLQTISGYAELMSVGMVQGEKLQEFSTYIYEESKRMSALIQDIINLSFLDEQSNFVKSESVDVYDIALQVQNELAVKTKKREIDLIVKGESSVICGITRLIHECIFNLCDNAINYNKPQGLVKVIVEDSELFTTLTVKDTGIGIPLCDQDRVFERFYRVDKSRSRSTGGTGLGMSIVKHVAALHDAKIELHSLIDVGTSIIIIFPKK
ncbi:MAG: ATP-binding protein [Clostridia bacterium]